MQGQRHDRRFIAGRLIDHVRTLGDVSGRLKRQRCPSIVDSVLSESADGRSDSSSGSGTSTALAERRPASIEGSPRRHPSRPPIGWVHGHHCTAPGSSVG